MSSLVTKSKSMTEPRPRRYNYTTGTLRERAPLTLQPQGARQRSASGELPTNIDRKNTFTGPSSMKKATHPQRARALPAVPPPITHSYTVSSAQSARRIRPLPIPASSAPSTTSFSSISSPLSSSPLSSSPLSSSPLSLSSLSSSPLSLSALSLSPSSSLTLLTPITPLSPTLPTPTSPISPILFASCTAWGAGHDNSSFGFVGHKIRPTNTSDSDEEDEDDEDDTDTLAEEPYSYQQNNISLHHRWRSIWRQPTTQDPPNKWVRETTKGHRLTVNNYANVLDALRAL